MFTTTDIAPRPASFTRPFFGRRRVFDGNGLRQRDDGFNVVTATPHAAAGTFTGHASASWLGQQAGHRHVFRGCLAGRTPDQRYITRLYQDLLGRAAEQGGLNFWSGLLANGTSRGNVVLGIEGSPEYQTKLVTNVYMKYLQRSPNSAELASGLAAVRAGTSVEARAEPILASPEYFQGHACRTNDGFLTVLYQDLLGRAVDAGGRLYFGTLLAGGESRQSIVLAIFNSKEYLNKVVDKFSPPTSVDMPSRRPQVLGWREAGRHAGPGDPGGNLGIPSTVLRQGNWLSLNECPVTAKILRSRVRQRGPTSGGVVTDRRALTTPIPLFMILN